MRYRLTDTRIVDQHIEPSVVGEGAVDQSLGSLLISEVSLHIDAIEFPRKPHSWLPAVPGVDHNSSPIGGEATRIASPMPDVEPVTSATGRSGLIRPSCQAAKAAMEEASRGQDRARLARLRGDLHRAQVRLRATAPVWLVERRSRGRG